MKNSKTKILLAFFISLILFLSVYYTFGDLFEFMLPKVDNGYYSSTNFFEQFRIVLLSSLTFGLIPFFALLTWRITPIVSKKEKIISILIVLTSMALAILVRQQMIRSYFSSMARGLNSASEKVTINYPLSKINFEYYLFTGLCIGCIISYVVFKQKSKQ